MGPQITYAVVGQVRAAEGRFGIEIGSAFKDGLDGLDGFSHVLVFWHAHLLNGTGAESPLLLDKPYTNGPARIGVFATRTPARPSPMCVSVAAVTHTNPKTGRIDLAWIDAEDGSPVLDVKPYHPSSDRVRAASTPSWCAHWPQDYDTSSSFDWAAEIPCAHG